MQSVESILKQVYGGEPEAAQALGVVRSAVSNWKKWGHFPARLLPKIVADASARRVKMPVSEVPIHQRKHSGDA